MEPLKGITLELILEFNDADTAKIVFNSVKPELEISINELMKTDAKLSNSTIFLTIYSTDLTELRATANSYLKWFTISAKTIQNMKK